jgi:hypothetical protein
MAGRDSIAVVYGNLAQASGWPTNRKLSRDRLLDSSISHAGNGSSFDLLVRGATTTIDSMMSGKRRSNFKKSPVETAALGRFW